MLLVVKRGIPVNRWALVSPLRSVTRRPPAPAFGYACFIIIATDQPTFMVNRGAAMSSAQDGSEADVGVIEKA